MSLTFEEYVKTAAPVSAVPSVGSFIRARPWTTGLTAAGLLGAGALAGHALSGNAPEVPEAPETSETPEAPIGLDWGDLRTQVLTKGLGTGLGEGLKAVGRGMSAGIRRTVSGLSHKRVFDHVTSQDPVLMEADPTLLVNSFNTMRRFAPTLASDSFAVQSFLREAVTSGGGINYNTLKLLAEAEKAANEV